MLRQTVFRANLDTGYTKISNALLQDGRLSYEARGLLTELLSRPADWEITIASIVKSGPAGRDKVYRMMAELEGFGYAAAVKQRRKDGAFTKHAWQVADDPALLIERAAKELDRLLPDNPEVVVPFPGKPEVVRSAKAIDQQSTSWKPDTVQPFPGNPDTGQPDPANPHTTKERQLQSTEVETNSPDSSLRSESAPMRRLPEIAAAIAAGILTAATPVAAGTPPPVHVETVAQSQPVATSEANADSRPKRRIRSGPPVEYTHDFEEFWKIYPRHVGKGEAFKQWQRLTLEQKRRAYRALKEQREMLCQQAADPRGNFCPHPRTWICQGRFDDDSAMDVQQEGRDRVRRRVSEKYDRMYEGVL